MANPLAEALRKARIKGNSGQSDVIAGGSWGTLAPPTQSMENEFYRDLVRIGK